MSNWENRYSSLSALNDQMREQVILLVCLPANRELHPQTELLLNEEVDQLREQEILLICFPQLEAHENITLNI